MNPASRNGLLIGVLAGCLLAWLTWDDSIIVAASAIVVPSLFGWFIGYYLSDKRTR